MPLRNNCTAKRVEPAGAASFQAENGGLPLAGTARVSVEDFLVSRRRRGLLHERQHVLLILWIGLRAERNDDE